MVFLEVAHIKKKSYLCTVFYSNFKSLLCMIDIIKKYITAEFIRFVLVAGLNTAFGYGVFSLLIFLGLSDPLAVLGSTVLGVLFNFKTYGILVFKNKNNKLIFRFLAVYCVVYICNVAGVELLKILGLSSYMAGAVMAIPVGLLGFVLNKTFVFSKNKNNNPE